MNDENKETAYGDRSAEEIAWDREFEQTKGESSFAGTIGDLLSLAIKVPVALIQMPINMLPTDTRGHARAAVREGFLAARSLVGAIGDSIEDMLADPEDGAGVVSGPPGTWGNTRHATRQTAETQTAGSGESPGKVRRIELEDDDAPAGEGRGLRADIDY